MSATNFFEAAWILKRNGVCYFACSTTPRAQMRIDFGPKAARKFNAHVAGADEGGSIELRLAGPEGKLIGICHVKTTGGWPTWRPVSCEVLGVTGGQDLCLKFTGGDKPLLNLEYWTFE